MNVGSRVIRAGFTGTRGVLVSAVPSAGVGGPAPLLGGPGVEVMLLAPAGDVHRGVAVPIGGIFAAAGEYPIGQPQTGVDGPALWAELAGGVPAVGDQDGAAAPSLFVAQQAGELGPAGIRDGAGQARVGQHPGHVQVLDDEPVVGPDQRARHLVQEMAAHIGDVTVMAQLGGGVTAVTGSFLLARQRSGQPLLAFQATSKGFGRIGDTGDFGTVGGGGDHKRRQTTVDTDPATIIGRIARLVLVGGVQVGGLHVQRHPPPAAALADGGEQNRGPVLGQHAPQSAGVIMHADLPDTGIPGQHLMLLNRRVKTEAEGGVPGHFSGEHPSTHRQHAA